MNKTIYSFSFFLFIVSISSSPLDSLDPNIESQIRKLQSQFSRGFQINGETMQKRGSPDVAVYGSGFAVCWVGFNQNNVQVIYAQLYSFAGVPKDKQFQVNTIQNLPRKPKITGLSSGGFVIVWEEFDKATYYLQSYGQIFNIEGLKSGIALHFVTDWSLNYNEQPHAASRKSGGFLVTWVSYYWYIYASYYFEDGTSSSSLLNSYYLTASIYAGEIRPYIANLYNDLFFMVYTFDSEIICGMMCSLTSCTPAYTLAYGSKPYITATLGGVLLIYLRYDFSKYSISTFGQFIDVEFYYDGGEITLHSSDSCYDNNPHVSVRYDGCFILSVDCLSQNTSDIYDLLFDPHGEFISGNLLVNEINAMEHSSNCIAVFPNGNFVIVWDEVGADYWKIKAKIFQTDPIPFRLMSNHFTIRQGENLLANRTIINAIGNGTITFIVSASTNGYFTISNKRVYSFTQADVDSLKVYFIHDNSLIAPIYWLTCSSDQSNMIYSSNTYISFIKKVKITKNNIVIQQFTKVVITKNNLDGVLYDGTPTIIYTVLSNTSCYFEFAKNPYVAIRSFSAQQIINLEVVFYAFDTPSYILRLNDSLSYIDVDGFIVYYIAIKLTTNQISIQQGKVLLINSQNFGANYDHRLSAIFIISTVKNGYFAYNNSINNDIYSFTETQLLNKEVYFVHDDSLRAPIIRMSVTDGIGTTQTASTSVTFVVNLELTKNSLKINTGEILQITTDFIAGSSIYGSSLKIFFIIFDIKNGRFTSNAQEISQFSLQNILDKQIFFTHDGSIIAPSYKVSIGDGSVKTDAIGALVSFNNQPPAPVLKNNNFIIDQWEKITLTSDNLEANDDINKDFEFRIVNIDFSYFSYSDDPEVPISSFKSSDIMNSNVIFVHDGSKDAPRFNLTILTHEGKTDGNKYSAVIYFNSEPVLITNMLNIKRGEKKIITSNTLEASDLESNANDLIFKIYNILYGMFINVNDPANAITSFDQYEVSNSEILFVHDGSINPPSYSVSVSDGSVTIESQTAIIDFLMTKGISGVSKLTLFDAELMRSIAITSNGLYVIASIYQGILLVIDINNHANPILLKSLDLMQYNITKISGLVLKNDFVYVLSESAMLAIIYVNDLKNPKFIGSLGKAKSSLDLAVCDNNYTYLAAETDGIYIISTENINENQSNASFIKSLSINGSSIASLACFGQFLYLVTKNEKPMMIVLNISNATDPKYINNVSLSSTGNFIKINPKGVLTFIGTNTGIDIFNISDNKKIANITTITLSFEVFSLDISENDEYLTVLGDLTMVTINIQQLLTTQQYGILDNLNYEFGLNQVLLLPNSHYGFIASIEGLQIFNIFRGLQSRLSPKLSSYYPNYLNATGNAHVIVSSDSSYCFILTMINGWEHLVIKSAKDFDSFNTTLKEINLTCNNMQYSSLVFPKKDTKTVYVINCGNLTTITINPTNHQLTKIMSTMRFGDAWGIEIAPNEDYLYITNNKTNQMHIVFIGKNSRIIANITLNGVPKMMSVSTDNKFVFVVLEKTGLAFINVTNKTNPQILNISNSISSLGDVRSIIYFTDIYGNQYIVVSLFYEGMIKIIDVSDASSPIILSKRYIGKQTAGLGLLPNKNFIVVQSFHRLTIVEIRNLTNPVIVNDIQSETIGYTYQIGVSDSAIFMPTFEIFKLYTGETFFYPHIFSNTSPLGHKFFLIQFFSISPKTFDKTQEKIKLLKIETEKSWPFWMTMDYEINTLTVTPPAMQSLNLLRKLKLNFGTQITEKEFAEVSDNNAFGVTSELLFQNYIDADLIPTNEYDPKIPIIFKNETVNVTAIIELLNKHVLYHYSTFYLNDFVSLDTAPINGEVSIQTQFDNYGVPKIDSRIDFQFDQFSFIDNDGDLLTYTAVGLPSFLQFNSVSFKIYGTPTKRDLGVYYVKIIASDGYMNISQNLTISVKNVPPTCISPGNQGFILGDNFDWQLPSSTFADEDEDQLTYMIKMIDETTQKVINAPNWLNLDDSRLRVYGKPEAKDIKMDFVNKRFYQNFTLRLNATDIADQTSSFEFNLTVQNYFPIYNPNLTLSMQFAKKYGSYIKIQQSVDFEFSASTFLDPENTHLTYTVTGLPKWLIFTSTSLFGTTSKSNLGNYTLNITASDGYYNATGSFLISVQNHPPIAYPLSDKTLILGHSFNHSFYSVLSFSDPDDDPLTFKAFLIENDTMTVLPSWIIFVAETLTFSGIPNADFIHYNETEGMYYQSFKIMVMALDLGDANATSSFNLIVKNNIPRKNKLLSNQFSSFVPRVEVDSEITFSEDTFVDENNDTLTYKARLMSDDGWFLGRRLSQASAADGTNLLPNWIVFDELQRKFSISPTSSNYLHTYTIKVICKNSMLEESDYFSFEVGMSAFYAFNIFLIVIGVVGSILGFYANRIMFYSIMAKNLYCYPNYEKVFINQEYQKYIYLIKEDLDVCFLIWKEIKKNHKDITKIFNSPQEKQTLRTFINEAANQLKAQKALEDYVDLEDLRLIVIFEGFLVLDTIKNHKFARKLFNRVKKLLTKKKIKLWYQELVTISDPFYECSLSKPLPIIEINSDKFQSTINQVLRNFKSYNLYEEIPEIDKKLLQGKLKAHVLGIPSPSSKLYKFLEYSRGESLWLDCNEISEIQYSKTNSSEKLVHSSIFDYPERNNYNSITNWLKYSIDKGMLIFNGKPTNHDLGKHIIRIFNNDDLVVREFGIEVLQNKGGLVKSEMKLGLAMTTTAIASEKVLSLMKKEKKISEAEELMMKIEGFDEEIKENLDLENQGKMIKNDEEDLDIEENSPFEKK